MTTQEFEVPLPALHIHADPKLDHEEACYRKQFPLLMRDYPEQFVAIHDGSVVAHGNDFATVAMSAYEAFGMIPILIRKVTSAPPRVVRIPTFTRL